MEIQTANKKIKQELIEEIHQLKKEKDAVILAHYYMTPDLQQTVDKGGFTDFIGDSLGLSVEATKIKAKNVIFCGVKFMAETAKILNPEKNILLPDMGAGCSLASSISANDIKDLRKKHPGVPIIAYVNTYAETKAEVDICCTSRNALAIAKSFEEPELIFVPDVYMGQNLQQNIEAQTGKKLILWHGSCEVHEQFTGKNMKAMQAMNPDAEMLMHWEVPKETVNTSFENSDGVLGSTNDILRYVGESKAQKFILASECDLGATLKGMYPDREFITPCFKCPYMKTITLENTLAALKSIGTTKVSHYEINLPEDVISRAYLPIKRMLEFT